MLTEETPQFDEFQAPAIKIEANNSLDYIFTKQQFKKIIKRLQEDPSAIWHDHLEREIKEFQMVQDAY